MKKKYPCIGRNIECDLYNVVEYIQVNENEKDIYGEWLLDMYCFYVLIEKYIMATACGHRSYVFISEVFGCINRLYPQIEIELQAVAFYAKRKDIADAAMFVRNRLNYILGYDGRRYIWQF